MLGMILAMVAKMLRMILANAWTGNPVQKTKQYLGERMFSTLLRWAMVKLAGLIWIV